MTTVDIPSTPLIEMGKARFGSKDALKRLQKAVDHLTRKGISGGKVTDEEKEFLIELFECFALGGRWMGYSEAAKLANHYVHGNGDLLQLDADIYVNSAIVKAVQVVMRRQIAISLRESKDGVVTMSSGDSRLLRRIDYQALQDKRRNSNTQGRVLTGGWLLTEQDNQALQKANNRFQLGSTSQRSGSSVTTIWRVDDEYVFEPFSKGFVTNITIAPNMTLRMPDGLSEHMTKIGAAKAFKHYAEWTDVWTPAADDARIGSAKIVHKGKQPSKGASSKSKRGKR